MRNKGGGGMKYLVIGLIFLLIGIGAVYGLLNREESENQGEMTEAFIHRWLQNDNGTFATYIQDSGVEDEDLVQGREALAETVGLLMHYALEIENQELFNDLYDQLNRYFLEQDGFINWKVNEEGTSEVSTNALIDDVRILEALVQAYEKWEENQYIETATSISDYLSAHNVKNGIYTNFYERKEDYASSEINLSYIDIQALDGLVEDGLLDAAVVLKTSQVLTEAPLDNGFYPLYYNIENEEYFYSDNVNLIDQALLAYHYAEVGNPSEEFLEFIKDQMMNRDLVHGMYDRQTKNPTVDYESPAIYGFLILYALEVGESELAESIYKRMKEFQVTDRTSDYFGGYSITDGNTHIFDHLVPMLAEQAIENN